ncbi:peptidoglycan/LPS O-acetylase OafA/YrhL [Barrientosiimonas humi]|uniref:Peptidoglycan/LPS O-acetylase OafA/YrhL n=1 Tax=Barrientosiimonas humi TaxID=999931 RepID=A0A542XBV0_9MICO|nr:acyltransferase family protein [Barrientosiimonas humi]TQL33322.1 peptidoglycan/LPS O-acetylase OafA/YrhL [Barrientosiimonas humi]CAG7573311.1 O-acetyltransferase OatA [Barrientosiimonas humi]
MTSPAIRPSGSSYRPALDGMRAISVITIMLFHAPVSWVLGGYWSVNVFFVVSGYLITGLLLKEWDKWRAIDLAGFYVRRARRLLPALLVMLLVMGLVVPRVMQERTPSTFSGDGIATLFYVANWRMIATGQSYFEQFGSPSPFRHAWTLGIEEQYYLIFPVLFIGLLKLAGRRKWIPIAVIGALTLLSAYLMARLATPGADPSRVYYGTDTRMQDILVGSLLAMGLHALGTRRVAEIAQHRRALAIVGWVVAIATLGWFLFVPAEGWAFTGGFLLFDVMFAMLILSVELYRTSSVARLFSLSWLVWVGKLSYGLYLWHWPIFVMLDEQRTGLSAFPLLVVRLALTFAFASASFYLIENPIRRGALKRLGSKVSAAVSTTSVAVTAAVLLVTTAGMQLAPNAQAGEAAQVKHAGGAFRLLIVGDSVGFSLGYNFPKESFPDVSATANVKFGCGTAEQALAIDGEPQPAENRDDCESSFDYWNQGLKETQPNAIVWSLGGWEVFDHVVDGKVLRVGSPEYARYLDSRLQQGLTALSPSNAPVVITNVPCYNQPSYVVNGKDLARDRNDPKRAAAVNQILSRFAAKNPERVKIADLDSFVCPSGKYQDRMNGVQVRNDGVHYTAPGARMFWQWLMPQINRWSGATTASQ